MTGLRRFLPRYTLRTLAIFILLATCVEALWLHWEPWYLVLYSKALLSSDGSPVVEQSVDWNEDFWICDGTTGARLRFIDLPKAPLPERDPSVTLYGSFWARSKWASSSANHLVAVEEDKAIGIWDADTGKKRATISERSTDFLTFSPDGRALAVSWGDDGVGTYDSSTGAILFKVAQTLEYVRDAQFVTTGSCLVVGRDRGLELWDIEKDEIVRTMERSAGYARTMARPSAGLLAAARASGDVAVWDIRSGRRVATVERLMPKLTVLALSPDGQRLAASAGDSGHICILSALDARMLWDGPHAGRPVQRLSFSADGQTLYAAVMGDAGTCIYRRSRPEWWWGVFYLKEFWATVFFAAFFAWSVRGDRRYFRRLDAEYAAERAAKAAAKAQAIADFDEGE